MPLIQNICHQWSGSCDRGKSLLQLRILNLTTLAKLSECTFRSTRVAMLWRAIGRNAADAMPTLIRQSVSVFAAYPRNPRVFKFQTSAAAGAMPGIELKVMDKLKDKHHAITTVESCTGGRVADLLTNVGGAAQVYWGSVITYDGSLKSVTVLGLLLSPASPYSTAVLRCCRSDWGVPVCSIKDVGTVTEQACTCSHAARGGMHATQACRKTPSFQLRGDVTRHDFAGRWRNGIGWASADDGRV